MLYIVLWCLFAIIAGMLASVNGKSVPLYILLGFLLGPIGIIIAAFPSEKKGE